ncbi:hypothetical protein [Thermotoga sp. SG1]|uniref:hypothetical protein n=1 Tax=Thermotoga sp. SG1 TaxID=126739 RepID=UPI000C7661F4|nr:hypothetical protein [Thermotoga sp. SG1]PLV55728.1 hypothetical protein AS006_08830 [Thermotoga sp. SG1]
MRSNLSVVNLINFSIGLLNVGLWVNGKNDFLLVIFFLNLVVNFLVNRDPSQVLIAAMTYPLGLLLPIKKKRPPFEVMEEPTTVETTRKIASKSLKESLFFGDETTKRETVLRVSEDVEKDEASLEIFMKASRKLMKDSDSDVVLYATESVEKVDRSFEDVEKFFSGETIEESKRFYEKVRDYLEADFLTGKVERYYKESILTRNGSMEKDEKYFVMKYKVDNDLSVLWEGLEKTKSPLIYRMLMIELLKQKDFEGIKKLKELFSQ